MKTESLSSLAQTLAMYNHLSYETTTSFDYNLNRAVHEIKTAQQTHRQELELRDEKILKLEKKLERLQSENHEFAQEIADFRIHNDKENSQYRTLRDTNHFLEQELSLEKSRTEELKLELSRVRKELKCQVDKVADLEIEHDKANHIIKTLVKKVQSQQQPSQHCLRSPLGVLPQANAASSGSGGGLLQTRHI